jgi:16S rRNA (guanine527-N7)-methyltransferase
VDEPPARAVDLGSGGGLPGLPLAVSWPNSTWVLLEANRRRAGFLVEAIAALELADRVRVRHQRAEETGRDSALRGSADLVVIRSFGPPAVSAECAAPLLRVGGAIVIGEPPPGRDESRWPEAGLAQLGLARGRAISEPIALQRLDQVAVCPARFPRRTGIPSKRPLF